MVLVITPHKPRWRNLVDALASKPSVGRRGGSSPPLGTMNRSYSIRVEYLFRNQGIQVRILLRPPTKLFFEKKNVKIIAKFVIYYCWKQQADL